ncbi:MAG: YHS domain-containing protein [Inquilinus sp.]|nr:YHS domain-containing protein [Inquilinus sp.]
MPTHALDRRIVLRASAALALAGATLFAWQGARAGPQYLRDGLALGGYDAVGYFDSGDAIRGDRRYAHDWNGATWHFASAGNRDRFAADPTAYAPEYDGFCAYAAASGYKADADPEAWSIVDGRLYVNYSAGIKRRWERDIAGYVAKADARWPSVNP